MLTLSAEALDDAARITLPDGKTVSSTDPGVDEVLSAVLGQPVTLTDTPPPGAALDRAVPEAVLRDGINAQVAATLIEIGAAAPPGTFVDFAPLHLITTATLDRIAELSPRELDVMAAMAEGKSNRGVAEALVISVAAVEKHITRIFDKLEIDPVESEHRRVHAVLKFLRES